MVHPGWNVLVPCEASVQQIYMAYEGGNADLPVNVTCGQGQQYASLRDLMAIPSHQHRAMLREPYMRVVNAQHLKRTQGDACHRTMLLNIGKGGSPCFWRCASGASSTACQAHSWLGLPLDLTIT